VRTQPFEGLEENKGSDLPHPVLSPYALLRDGCEKEKKIVKKGGKGKGSERRYGCRVMCSGINGGGRCAVTAR